MTVAAATLWPDTRRYVMAATFAVSMAMAGPALAQQAEQAQAPPTAPPADGSLTHSAVKATTFKIATTMTGLAIFSYGTGSVVGGGLLTAFNVSKGWLLFTVNDYAWDKYAPTTVNKNSEQAFDVSASVWRNTLKFITYKSVETAIKFASIYVYTGSVSAMFLLGSVSAIANTGVYYANNLLWDWHDWSNSPPPVAPAAPVIHNGS